MAQKDSEARIRKDAKKRIRFVDHSDEPYLPRRMPRSRKPAAVAAQYIREYLKVSGVASTEIRRRSAPAIELRYVREKTVGNVTVVEFEQQLHGLPVWRSGVAVSMNRTTLGVVGSTVTYDHDLRAKRVASRKLERHSEAIDADLISKCLALGRNVGRTRKGQPRFRAQELGIEVSSVRPLVYRYDASRRQRPEAKGEARGFLGEVPRLALPKVDPRIKDGRHYVVNEVLFTTRTPAGELNWRVFIDPDTDSALYVRPLVAHVSGLVYDHDPLTATGDGSIVPSSATADLNAVRTPRPLPGIVPSAPQALSGEYVAVLDVAAPTIAPPTVAAGNFDYDADSDDFSAVNAYYHSDAVFRLVEEMGFDMGAYFDGTSFPVPVDHRGKSGQVNAKAPGNVGGDGSDGFRFGVVQAGQPVGIATDVRIVLHEFGHAVLWDNVWSPNFGFAHSAGDSLAALLGDPRSQAPDRFLTFPWLTAVNPGIDRRHDRDVTAGWAWGGVEDDGQYGSEQILSTSHFRAYLSLGGGSAELCEREFASRYLAYLILCGIGLLTPTTNSNSPEDWAAQLMTCDKSTDDFEGHPGGLVHKVIRWAFEKQGAYQPPGAPTPVVSEGAPPEVDVYINDGRQGEYGFSEDYCRTTEIWNRHRPDGGAAHQVPIPGIVNHAYAIVRNRGTEEARRVRVRGFHHVDCRCGEVCCCEDCGGMIWPNDFKPMLTARIRVGDIAAGGYAIVGPFEWVPAVKDCMMMIARARGDRNNARLLPASHTVPVRRFVPFDNNIAIRQLCEACGAVWRCRREETEG